MSIINNDGNSCKLSTMIFVYHGLKDHVLHIYNIMIRTKIWINCF